MMALHPLQLKSNGYPAVRRSSPETTLFLQQLGERAPEPRHAPEWRSLPCHSGEGRLRPDVDQKLGVGERDSFVLRTERGEPWMGQRSKEGNGSGPRITRATSSYDPITPAGQGTRRPKGPWCSKEKFQPDQGQPVLVAERQSPYPPDFSEGRRLGQGQRCGHADLENTLDRRDKIDMAKGVNFVATNDIIGGNSGSPMVNKKLEVIGLIFDGNIEMLGNRFVYKDDIPRSVSVHSEAILEALSKIYDADRIVAEIRH